MTSSARIRNRLPARSGTGTPAIAPIARAIRNALVASSMALALAVPVAARADVWADVWADPTLVDGAPPSAVVASARQLLAARDDSHPAATIVDIVFDGVIDEVDDVANGPAFALGIENLATQFGGVTNNGSVAATASSGDGNASAYGIGIDASIIGVGRLINAGDLAATATAGTGATANATAGFVYADVASLFNDGSAHATATAEGGIANARAAWTIGMNSTIANYGDLGATANAGAGVATARGAEAYGVNLAAIDNQGDIQALATANDDGGVADATGTYAMAVRYSSYSTNTGTIAASAIGDQATANGIINAAVFLGNAVTINEGTITANAVGGTAAYGEIDALAFGVYNAAYVYDSVVVNSGSISATAAAMTELDPATGLTRAQALGIVALNTFGYGQTLVLNDGDVSASSSVSTGLATSWGIAAQSSGRYGGGTYVENSGDVFAETYANIGVAEAIGVSAANYFAAAEVLNHGDITAVASTVRGVVNVNVNYAYATGVRATSPYGQANVSNYGDITALASAYGAITGARGVQTQGGTSLVTNAAGATITAMGIVDGFGGGFATAVEINGTYYAGLVNDGTIIAYGSSNALYVDANLGFYGASRATGVYAVANVFGDVNIVNNGDIIATAVHHDGFSMLHSGAGATGIQAYGKYDATIVNNGLVAATATSELGIVGAYGLVGEGKYSTSIVNNGDVYALATVGSLGTDYLAGRAVAMGLKVFNSDYASIVNDGLVVAHATVTIDETPNASPALAQSWGATIGYNTVVVEGDIANFGDIESVATAPYGYATAYGTYVNTRGVAATTNAGTVLAAAISDHGDAWAVGSLLRGVETDYIVPCDENGCDYGNAYFLVVGGDATLVNSGDITAIASAEGGTATAYGAVAIGGSVASIVNTGDIRARAEGDAAHAVGALVNGLIADASLDNGGSILAAAWGDDATAIGVELTSFGTNTLLNSGSIGAFGDGERFAIRSSVDAVADLTNAGTVVGAVRTGDLADTFTNAVGGTWFAIGDSSFGGGDDLVDNNGVVVVRGIGNRIDLGAVGTFRNDGVIVFGDGHTGDRLAITGTFAGIGAIGFDVDAAAGTSDRLDITGDVLAGSVQTLNVNLLARPETATFDIALVNVSGASTAGNFVLGDVGYRSGFVTLDFDLVATINNGGADSFALAVAVDGLNDAGSLAAAIAPGVQSLVDAQLGSWRQRAGAAPDRGEAAPVPWVRVFSASGDIEAGHAIGVGSGDLGFHQSNRGQEVGIEFPVGDRLALGGFFADSDGDQRLNGANGSSRLDGQTFGLYATWRDDRYYVDASQRWTGVDVRLHTGNDVLTTEMAADTFNFEAGFTAWTVGGTHIVPQLQYTHTRIGDAGYLAYAGSEFADDGGTSARGRLGVAFDRRIEGDAFVLTPYASLNVVHEFEGDFEHAVNGGIEGHTDLSGTAGMVEFGLGATRDRLTLAASANWTDGGAFDGVFGAQLSLRWAW